MSRTATTPVQVRASGDHPRGSGRWRRGLVIASFLTPALIVLGALVVYPIVYTVVRSLYDRAGTKFIGWQNYVTMFTNDSTFTAIRNNLIWVIVAPAACTILGLIFAVLLKSLHGRPRSNSSCSCPWQSRCSRPG